MGDRFLLVWIIVTGWGCDREAGSSEDAEIAADLGVDAAPVEDAGPPDTSCSGSWHPADEGVTCAPPPLREDCPAGSFALPDGTCTPVWECPEGWSRLADDIGCEPPPLREDCPAGSFALPDGTCTPVWE